VCDHKARCLPVAPETFPKQQAIVSGGFGNWLRVPGRHHTREHWSCAWGGSAWLSGDAAVGHILGLRGDSPELIPAAALAALGKPAPPRAVPHTSWVPSDDALVNCISAYIGKLPAGLGEGQHRDDFGFRLAAFLTRDLALSDADARPWMREWDARNAAAKGDDALEELLANARKYGKNPVGCGLRRLTQSRQRRSSKHPLNHIRVIVEG
jgi:hypothetical protein